LGRLNTPSIDLGIGLRVGAGDRAIMAAEGGRRHAIAARVVARKNLPAIGNTCSIARSSPHLPTPFGAVRL